MTVNKSQNQFLKIVKDDLQTFTFTNSQFYIILSQVTNIPKVTILFSENSNRKTNNVVYPEILFKSLQS